jgi:hypothetical protein
MHRPERDSWEKVKLGHLPRQKIKYAMARQARVAELADAQDLGSCVERREGSSPSSRIH